MRHIKFTEEEYEMLQSAYLLAESYMLEGWQDEYGEDSEEYKLYETIFNNIGTKIFQAPKKKEGK